MAKRQNSGVLNRLAGKSLVFNGKFGYGVLDSVKAMAEAQRGAVRDDLDDKVDYLVLADLSGSKTIQKKALSLNAKGATIQVIDVDAFKALAEPTAEEVLELLRSGESETYTKIHGRAYYVGAASSPKYTFHSEDLDGVNLEHVNLRDIRFDSCGFVGAKLNQVQMGTADDCDFSKATIEASRFGDARRCKFTKAALAGSHFEGDFSGVDFTGAALGMTWFSDGSYIGFGHPHKVALLGVVFSKAQAQGAKFHGLHLKSPDFSDTDLTGAEFGQCSIESGAFRNATLREAGLVECKLAGCDLTNADLTGANLAGADLSGAMMAGANLKDANLRGTKLDGVDLSKVKNFDPNATVAAPIGPALTELDAVHSKARRIQVSFHVRAADGEEGDPVGIDSNGLRWGWGVQVPASIGSRQRFRNQGALAFSDAMLHLANVAGNRQVRFETLEVSSTKSPTGGKELRDLVMRSISEAFGQPIPAEEELAAATKTFRSAEREKGAAAREQREQAKAQAAKEKEKAKKQLAKKIEKTVGKVSDVASFLKALELRIEKPKIDKATKMLKASGFKLFNDVTDQDVSGVVKSQTDPDLVYACRVMHDGQYACCTQNLNICGGLRGSICKHLLVLIIGLVQAGELDPTTIDAWIAKTHSVKPELDKEVMGAIFIKYKGAEAGEVDWRPTETVPEDYYTL
jgi:uncharacterized protein YjbI with pentapeptide repeats